METKTADLKEAREFADAIHAVYPDKMLAYNLSPSFNWDTTGMTDAEMRRFPEELGKMGYVFNFITYGGHQIDGVAAEEFATALKQDGMLALARLQRKIRLLESPYKTPQTLVGGPRLDEARWRLPPAGLRRPGRWARLDAAPAPGADRGTRQVAGRLAGPVVPALRLAGRAAGEAAARTAPVRSCWSWSSAGTGRGQGPHRLRDHHRPQGPQHPVGARD